jgi:hypothetical protein
MSPDRQDELQDLMKSVLTLKMIQELSPDDFLKSLKFRLVKAGEKVKRTMASLTEHLRRFLAHQAWLENKRIVEIIRSIEREAMRIRENPPRDLSFVCMDDVSPDLNLTMARGLFVPPQKAEFRDLSIEEGTMDVVPDVLYQAHFVDENMLRDRLDRVLQEKSSCTLGEICVRFPLEKGLAELLAYFTIAGRNEKVCWDPATRQTIAWETSDGQERKAVVPRVIFNR